MRRLLIILACALVVGTVVYQVLEGMGGYLLLSAGPYVIETSLWGAFLSLLVAFLLVYILWRLARLLLLPRQWWQGIIGRKVVKNRNQTVQGMLDYLDGNWPSAIENLHKGVKRSETPALNYLGAAAASFHLGDTENVKALLQQAEENGVTDAVTTGLLQIRLLLQKDQYDKALIKAESLLKESPHHPSLLRMVAAARRGIGDWQGLESMIGELKKQRALSESELGSLEEDIYLGLISTTGQGSGTSSREQELKQVWDRVPSRLQETDRLIAAYIGQLRKQEFADKAERLLRRHLNRHWSEILVREYGLITSDPSGRLVTAEAWLRDHPDSPELLHALGRICIKGQLWGKARDYLESAIRLKASPEIWFELGELLKVIQDDRRGSECFRRGLALAVGRSSSGG